MDRQTVLNRLSGHERELRALGLKSLALFGSTARGESRPDSDVDLAAKLDEKARLDLLDFIGIQERLSELLDVSVDLVSEPARKARLQAEIDRDRVCVF